MTIREPILIGVIGGSGLYQMDELTDREALSVPTPFGAPSGDIIVGTLRGKRVAFLPRHGVGHLYTPSTVPYQANIYALKSLGVRFIIGVNAAGSLREDFAPGHIVIPDQIIDYTNSRPRSFFDTGLVAHVSVAEPYCAEMRAVLIQAVSTAGGIVHGEGVFLIEEGPRFATRAESYLFRSWGCDLIGMTTCPEAFLAREAEIAYATMAHITDYDSWHQSEEPVTVERVVETLHRNVSLAQEAVAQAVALLDENAHLAAHDALATALLTDRSHFSQAMIERLGPLVSRYVVS